MSQHVHLQDRFLCTHRLDGELFAPDDVEFIRFVFLFHGCDIGGFLRIFFQCALPDPLGKLGLVLADLTLDGSNSGINGCIHVIGQLVGTVVHAVVFDGDLGTIPPALNAEGDKCFSFITEQFIQFSDLPSRVRSQIFG